MRFEIEYQQNKLKILPKQVIPNMQNHLEVFKLTIFQVF